MELKKVIILRYLCSFLHWRKIRMHTQKMPKIERRKGVKPVRRSRGKWIYRNIIFAGTG